MNNIKMNNIKIAKELVKVARELVGANAEYSQEDEKWLLEHGFVRGNLGCLEITEGRFVIMCFPPTKNDSRTTCACSFLPINVGGINYAGCEFKGKNAKEAVQGCVNKFRASIDKLRKNVSEMTDALNDALSVVRKF